MTEVATQTQVLDVTTLAEAQGIEEALRRFDGLSAGEAVEIRLPGRAAGLLRALRKDRPGLFEWSPLEEGPGRWVVRLDRRDAAAGSQRLVTECLSWDHDRLEAVEQEAFAARAAGDFAAARTAWGVFARGLNRHIGFEEEILFPVFERHAGMPPDAGPTAVMREEHEEIRRLLASIGAAIGGASGEAERLRQSLHYALEEHNRKEEEVLYPATDQWLSPGESDDLVGRIQAYSAPRL